MGVAGIIYIMLGISLKYIFVKDLNYYIKYVIKSLIITGGILIILNVIELIYHTKLIFFQGLCVLIMVLLNIQKLKKYEKSMEIEKKLKKNY